MKDKRRYVRASYTVEMALLMPLILTVIVFVIYWMFYFHDRCVLSSAAYSAALKGSLMINGEDVVALTRQKSEELIKNRLIATTNIEPVVSIKGKEIYVKYSGELIIPSGTVFVSLLNKGNSAIEVEAVGRATTVDAVKFIRECRFVENAAQSAKRLRNGNYRL